MPRQKDDDENKHWEKRLSDEGLTEDAGTPPPWHTASPANARRSMSRAGNHTARLAVQLPSDWEDGAQPDFANRVLSTAINREMAAVLNARLEEYVWRECNWSVYPADHKRILEAYVTDGPADAELAERFSLSISTVTRTLRLHRLMANLTLDDLVGITERVRAKTSMDPRDKLLWSAITQALPALKRFQ